MFIDFNFSFYLLLIFVLLTLVVGISKWRLRHSINTKPHFFMRMCKLLWPIVFFIWILRSFIVQPYHIPTGSLEPTILPDDFILVTQFDYGIHFPVFHWLIAPTKKPAYGQIAVFRWPLNPNINYVKRVVGLPGDHIEYINRVLYINGQACKHTYLGMGYDELPGGIKQKVGVYEENLMGVRHKIYLRPHAKTIAAREDFSLTVPKAEYFMMGDNRESSLDSRSYGAVPLSSFIGQARLIWFSYNEHQHKIRWSRIGERLS